MRRLLAYTRCYPGILWVDGFAHGPYLLGLMQPLQACLAVIAATDAGGQEDGRLFAHFPTKDESGGRLLPSTLSLPYVSGQISQICEFFKIFYEMIIFLLFFRRAIRPIRSTKQVVNGYIEKIR